jgi:hypothetical protein
MVIIPVQSLKAEVPIFFTLSGIVTDVMYLHLSNADSFISVTGTPFTFDGIDNAPIISSLSAVCPVRIA